MSAVLLIALLAGARPEAYEVIIAGGGKTRVEAEQALARIESKLFYLRHGRKNGRSFPKVMRSDELKGLKPGFFVAVLGLCKTTSHPPKARKALLFALREIEKGAYARGVEGTFDDSCPPLAAIQVADERERALREAVDKNPADAAVLLRYAEYLEHGGRFDEALIFLDRVLEISPDSQAARDLAHKISVLQMD